MNKKLIWLIIVFMGTLLSQSAYPESQPLKELKSDITRVQQVLADRKLVDAQNRGERRRVAVNLLHQIFDFDEMSRRSLGANARKYNDRLGEFTPLFVSLLEQTYMAKLEENGDARIEYLKDIVNDDNAQVDTKTTLKDGSDYTVTYKLHLSPSGWRVYDVVVEGVSIVNNYRAQFDRFLSKNSFDQLLQTLREKKTNVI